MDASKLSVPVGMIGSLVMGFLYVADVRSETMSALQKNSSNIEAVMKDTAELEADMRTTWDKVSSQDERLSRMEGKQDLILGAIQSLEGRLNKK